MIEKDHKSDSDDDAPESISFDTGKLNVAEQTLKVKEQVKLIRESQKKKRIERQEKFIEQKKRKFDNIELPEEVLEAVGDESQKASNKNSKKEMNKKKKFDDDSKSKENKTNDIDNSLSDFIPLKSYSKYGISVVNLEKINKKPLISSDRAKAFKSEMYNRRGIRRQTAMESLALKEKIKIRKISSNKSLLK